MTSVLSDSPGSATRARPHDLGEGPRVVGAPHARKRGVTARLQRQVQVGADLPAQLRHGGHDIGGHLGRLDARRADLHAGACGLGDEAKQVAEADRGAVGRGGVEVAVAPEVDAGKDDLARPLGDDRADLVGDLSGIHRAARAPRAPYYAVRAAVVASVLHLDSPAQTLQADGLGGGRRGIAVRRRLPGARGRPGRPMASRAPARARAGSPGPRPRRRPCRSRRARDRRATRAPRGKRFAAQPRREHARVPGQAEQVADGLARLGLRLAGDRAGVHEHDVPPRPARRARSPRRAGPAPSSRTPRG